MIEHINSVKTIAEHLEAIGNPIAEHELVIILISSLTEEFNFLIAALEAIAEDNLTWDYVRDRLKSTKLRRRKDQQAHQLPLLLRKEYCLTLLNGNEKVTLF